MFVKSVALRAGIEIFWACRQSTLGFCMGLRCRQAVRCKSSLVPRFGLSAAILHAKTTKEARAS
jgi:hypothetical protein